MTGLGFAAAAAAISGIANSAPSCGAKGWAQLPSAPDMQAVYPEKAHNEGVAGLAVVQCTTKADGALADCSVESESPAGYDFGAAALKLVGSIRANPPCPGAPPSSVRLPIRFELPPQAPLREAVFQPMPRKFASYAWLAPIGPYWPEHALRANEGGAAAIECRVETDLHLKDCRVVAEKSPKVGFGDAMLRMAEVGWMTAAPLPPGAPSPPDGIWRFELSFPARSLLR